MADINNKNNAQRKEDEENEEELSNSNLSIDSHEYEEMR